MTRAVAIDTATGQATETGGTLARRDATLERVLRRIRVERWSSAAGDFGSELHRIRKGDSTAPSAVVAEIRRCLAPEVDAGEVVNLEVTAELLAGATAISWSIAYETPAGEPRNETGVL